jgi:Uma2 family endonuclease
MSTATVRAPDLLTAEEYGQLPDSECPDELVRGKVVPMAVPNRRHGQICNKAGRIIGNFSEERDLGHLLSNDAGVITHRNPDTVRGADGAFYSYAKLPKGPLPQSYGPEIPELVIEVRSPSDRWVNVLAKVAEYLEAGVLAVVVLDEESQTALLQLPDAMPRRLSSEEELTLPEILPGFTVAVRMFFE